MQERSVLGPPTKADAVYEEIRRQIMLGELEPGSRIDYPNLAETLGMSITPVREALRRLEADHLVLRSAHRGVVIASLSEREARELVTVRRELNVLAARLASESMTEEEIAAARHLIEAEAEVDAIEFLRTVDHAVTTRGHTAVNRAFHYMVIFGSHNRVLIESLQGISARTERYAVVALRMKPTWSRPKVLHRELLDAIAARDVQTTEALMRADQLTPDFVDVIYGAGGLDANVA